MGNTGNWKEYGQMAEPPEKAQAVSEAEAVTATAEASPPTGEKWNENHGQDDGEGNQVYRESIYQGRADVEESIDGYGEMRAGDS
jgi:hypothetical protein